jgi:cell division transport system ATP-binding protein
MKIVFDHVTKKYGLINALKDVSFTVEPGEFVFIVGHSGAGKSSLVKLLLNQIKPSSGTVTIDEHQLEKSKKNIVDQIRRQIGVVFQDYQLITDKTIEENIAIALDIINYPSAKIASQIDLVINQVNLNSRRFLFPSQLSGGELQRAALARAIAVEPKIILADEPTGNLDAENAWNLIKLFKDINETTSTTIIMTTHNQDIVDSLGKRVIKIKNGEIESDSMPPKTESVKTKKNIHSSKK